SSTQGGAAGLLLPPGRRRRAGAQPAQRAGELPPPTAGEELATRTAARSSTPGLDELDGLDEPSSWLPFSVPPPAIRPRTSAAVRGRRVRGRARQRPLGRRGPEAGERRAGALRSAPPAPPGELDPRGLDGRRL